MKIINKNIYRIIGICMLSFILVCSISFKSYAVDNDTGIANESESVNVVDTKRNSPNKYRDENGEPMLYIQSDELQKQMSDINARVAASDSIINNYNNEVQNVQNEQAATDEEKQIAFDNYTQAKTEFENNYEQIDNAIKDNCAVFYTKELLDEVVGNSFISNVLFNWDILCLFASNEDKDALETISKYKYESERYYELCNKGRDIENRVNDLKTKLAEEQKLVITLKEEQGKQQGNLDKMLKIEEEYGKSQESCITGTAIFNHPCPSGTIVSGFGETRGEGDTSGGVHKGTDFASPMGSPIYAAEDGLVIDATYTEDFNMGMGMMIWLQHENGLVTKYFHCSKVFIPIGMKVKKGQNLALVGSTGDSTGPHLHFQVELNQEAVDSTPYLKPKES